MRRIPAVLLIAGLMATPVSAGDERSQGSQARSGKSRVIGTVLGAAGGFALGIFAGLNWFDDAVNSDRKVWTTAVGFAGAGAVGGYLIGRAAGRSDARTRPAVARRCDDSDACSRLAFSGAGVQGIAVPMFRSLRLEAASRRDTHRAFRPLFSSDPPRGTARRALSIPVITSNAKDPRQ